MNQIKTERTNQSLFPSDYWKAWIEGQEEEGPYGSGETEAEAIADLEDQMEHETDFTAVIEEKDREIAHLKGVIKMLDERAARERSVKATEVFLKSQEMTKNL